MSIILVYEYTSTVVYTSTRAHCTSTLSTLVPRENDIGAHMHAHIYIYWLTSVHMLAQHSLAKSSGMSTAMAMITGSL